MCEFEKKVKNNLDDILKTSVHPRLGVAVSGGADSISLLLAVSAILPHEEPLFVITVNHNIRPAAESGGDAQFVKETCRVLEEKSGRKIHCEIVELEPGLVAGEAEKRAQGIEEAARFLRYQAFEKFIGENRLSLLCLAHNQNDQLETLLMRFLQGSTGEAAAGIKARRSVGAGDGACVFARPLLGVTRAEIEEYVKSRGYSWRTDKTNFETDYLRNRIRHKLVPLLDEQFPGWQKAVLGGAEKSMADAAFIQSFAEKFPYQIQKDGSVVLALEDFLSLSEALKYRVLLDSCNKAGETSRIPHQFLKDVIFSICNAADDFSKRFSDIDIIKEKNHLFVKKHAENNTDFVFFDIIEKTGTFEFPFGTLDVFNYREQGKKRLVSVCAGEESLADGISLPFCVRNASSGDTVICADGSEKKVSDILSDWHVSSSKKSLVPVIQLLDEKAQRIKAVLGGFLGYKDWIVKL